MYEWVIRGPDSLRISFWGLSEVSYIMVIQGIGRVYGIGIKSLPPIYYKSTLLALNIPMYHNGLIILGSGGVQYWGKGVNYSGFCKLLSLERPNTGKKKTTGFGGQGLELRGIPLRSTSSIRATPTHTMMLQNHREPRRTISASIRKESS